MHCYAHVKVHPGSTDQLQDSDSVFLTIQSFLSDILLTLKVVEIDFWEGILMVKAHTFSVRIPCVNVAGRDSH